MLAAVKERIQNPSISNRLCVILTGVILLSILAQVRLYLPFSPVPITGQTFGVAFIALIFGRNLGVLSVASYLLVGGLGLPVFSGFQSGLVLGPTFGYLMGMLVASFVIGSLSDLGFAKSWPKAFFACLCGSLITFSFGLFVLSFFVSFESLFILGLYPFLAGDFLKNLAASFIASRVVR